MLKPASHTEFRVHAVYISPVLPGEYTLQTPPKAMNGSSPSGWCANHSRQLDNRHFTCNDPASSVLFDSHTPTATELNSSTWASQLLTLESTRKTNVTIVFNFTATSMYAKVGEVEIALYNCPERKAAIKAIHISEHSTPIKVLHVDKKLSCNDLVHVCASVGSTSPVLTLQFEPYDEQSTWLYLAELTFREEENTHCREERNHTNVHTMTPETNITETNITESVTNTTTRCSFNTTIAVCNNTKGECLQYSANHNHFLHINNSYSNLSPSENQLERSHLQHKTNAFVTRNTTCEAASVLKADILRSLSQAVNLHRE